MLLALGVLSACAYDFVGNNSVNARVGGWIDATRLEWILFSTALPFRLFTYAALFLSFPILAAYLRGQKRRLFLVTVAWYGVGLVLMLGIWIWMASTPVLGLGIAVKRMSPDTIAHFDRDVTLAIVALGTEQAKTYTWSTAIVFEVLALIVISAASAVFIWHAAHSKSQRRALYTPFVPVLVLIAYKFIAPWSLDFDFDIFVGDALLGATLLNSIFFPHDAARRRFYRAGHLGRTNSRDQSFVCVELE